MDTNTGEPRGCCFCGFALSATGAPRSPPLHPCPRRPRRPARLSSPPHRRRPARPLTSCIIFLRCRAAMFPPHHLSTRVSDAGARLAGRTQRSAAPSGRHSHHIAAIRHFTSSPPWQRMRQTPILFNHGSSSTNLSSTRFTSPSTLQASPCRGQGLGYADGASRIRRMLGEKHCPPVRPSSYPLLVLSPFTS